MEDHWNQDKKRKDIKGNEKQDKKTKDREDHENQDKKTKGEARKERRKGWNMECYYEEQAKKRSTGKRESQAKKRKGKRILKTMIARPRRGRGRTRRTMTPRAKKRKKQKKEEHETQANKRKSEEKEPKKRRPLENYKRILDHLRKGRGRDNNNVLKLKVEAERVNKKRSLSEYCRVHLEEGLMTDATVRGHPCLVFFDTGASASIIFLSLARRAGLLTGREKT
ncbi:uncharacterized protein LOC135092295 [Scylla paramamosain]|uniref:uncharacterized protein LOC135092295 n=1 Tax=Scylla paramamosain TaxID=85552 RepID=UPI003083DB5F